MTRDDIDDRLLSLGLSTMGMRTLEEFFQFVTHKNHLKEHDFQQTVDAFRLFDKLEEGGLQKNRYFNFSPKIFEPQIKNS